MPINSFPKINQKEYLKKYLSGDKVKKKKKSKKHRLKDDLKVKIIDDDAGALPDPDVDEELLLTGEDAPQIVATYIAEDTKQGKKWKSIAIKEEKEKSSEVVKIFSSKNEDELWGPKPVDRRIRDEFSPIRGTNSLDCNLAVFKSEPKSPVGSVKSSISSKSKSQNESKDKRNSSSHKRNQHSFSNSDRTVRYLAEENSDHRRRLNNSPDETPSRRRRRSVSADQSPKRRRRRDGSGTQSSRCHKDEGSFRDRSPLYPNKRISADQKSTHHKYKETSVDQSPPRRRKRNSTDRILPRKHREISSDHSPMRNKGIIGFKAQRELDKKRDNYMCDLACRTGRDNRHADSSSHHSVRVEDSPFQSPLRREKSISTDRKSLRKHKYTSPDRSPIRQKKASGSDGQREHYSKRDNHMCDIEYRHKKDDGYVRTASHHSRRGETSSGQNPTKSNRKIRKPSLEVSNYKGQESFKSPSKIKIERYSPDLSPIRKLTGNREGEISKTFKKESISPGSGALKTNYDSTEVKRFLRKSSRSLSPPPTHKPQPFSKTLDGKRTGLQNAATLRQECLDRRLKEDELYAQMPIELTGRDAEVQVRSYGRRGKRAEKALNIDPEEERRKEEHELRKKELYKRWGKGLKQIEEYRAKVDQDLYEGSKPLARYSNDADLEKYLRDQERPDDPMLEYMRRKRKDQQPHTRIPTIPTYQGTYPENRFGIRPGFRWDGVDRSNGYEKKWFDIQNEKQAKQDEAYKYSVEDL